ncbi:hypothetical protein GSI_02392 [Ganoderma sinense ZZ0214-1]|uniref:Uncharacterized protein n=1 Tax=Ganoderma sinense ZZ0214-1 TaxID=1077348 RepID=A0A2G8SPJ0_9APHY|nr:hypothetical protein GSI_02392 [Ganoderma sinense ZZ0214-1]
MSSTLDSMIKTPATSRKRKLALGGGREVDLQDLDAETVEAEVVEAMKQRIIELEDQLAAKPPPTKRARTSAAAAEAPQASGSGAPSKADEKKRKAQLKKICDRLKKECKSEKCKFQGSPKSIRIEEIMEYPEFEAIFMGKGTLIQPTPTNKPKSTVTIIEYRSREQINALFGEDLKALKGIRWSRGGAPFFEKSLKLGQCDVEIAHVEVNYSKNGMKCALKFEVQEEGRRYSSDGW